MHSSSAANCSLITETLPLPFELYILCEVMPKLNTLVHINLQEKCNIGVLTASNLSISARLAEWWLLNAVSAR